MDHSKFEISQEKIDEFIKQLEESQDRRDDFIENRSRDMMDVVANHLCEHGFISDEDMLYNPEQYEFSDPEYSWLFEVIINHAEDRRKFGIEESNPFYHLIAYLRHNGLDILCRKMCGQGTVYEMWVRTEEDEWIEEYVVTFDEVLGQ